MSDFGFRFDNTYARLPSQFFAAVKPVAVTEPKLVVFNHALAEGLGLRVKALAERPQVLSGNEIPEGAEPIAQAYAGHQFGNFTMLGDGRAHLLGEHLHGQQRFDVQLKGSGQTPFSRRGDGRAALGPMLREYLISEAMHALGIPSTRSLAVVTTGEPVYRERPLPGAILTRVAASHIRVGTFEYAAAIDAERPGSLRTLADYTIARHYPEIQDRPDKYLALLAEVVERQAALVAGWMLVGFVHGVMNTDNMALSGETIDYGPCAFMDHYSHATLFSSIDRHGRYAYGNQPKMAEWDLTRLAEALLPLFAAAENEAVEKAKEVISSFAHLFHEEWLRGMRAKLGYASAQAEDVKLIEDLLKWMELHQADYTNTFRELSHGKIPAGEVFRDEAFGQWFRRWQAGRPDLALMRESNPVVIPRNHRVEEALRAATEENDYAPFTRLVAVMQRPFADDETNQDYRAPAPGGGEGYRTFCGT